MSSPAKQLYEFGRFRLDAAEHTLLRDGRPVALRPKVFDLLLVLIEHHGHLVDKEELMNSLWTEQFVEEGNLNKNISMLRRTLGEGDNGQQFIETVPKRGYRFIADVQQVDALEEPASMPLAPSITPLAAVDERASTDLRANNDYPRPGRGIVTAWNQLLDRGWAPFVIVPLLLMLVAVAVVLKREKRPSVTPKVSSIVVLPFQNLSADPAQEYFVDGMTDALTGNLAKIGALRVISRTSAMHYKGTNKSVPEIATELHVDAVVEGTVQRSGNRVYVRAQLIHAASDSHLWAADYERDLGDALDLQSDVARAIAGEIRIKTTSAEQELLLPKRAIARAAIDNYLQGRYFWNKRTVPDLLKAADYFEASIKADPDYAQAYAGLADCYNQLGSVMISVLPPSEARRTAEAAARKALEIDNELAEAHAALAYINHYNWNWVAAEDEYKRAIELNSNYASAHSQYALYLVCRGRFNEALAESDRAQELDPLSLAISSTRGFALYNVRHYEEAAEQFRRVIAMDPNHYQAYWYLGFTQIGNGQLDAAIATSEKAVAASRRAPATLGVLGMAYGFAGRKREAKQVLNELLQMQKQRYVTPVAIAQVYTGLGKRDEAFAWLEKISAERSYMMAYIKVSPTMDTLRNDARFVDLLRRTGLNSE